MLSPLSPVSHETGLFELQPERAFVLALAPAVSRRSFATAHIVVVKNTPSIDVGYVDLDERHYKHLLSLPTMESVNLQASPSGSVVAVSQGKFVYAATLNGSRAAIPFETPIEQFGFVNDSVLLVRCKTQLLSIELETNRVSCIRNDVRRIAIGQFVIVATASGAVDFATASGVAAGHWSALPNVDIPRGSRTAFKTAANALFIAAEGPCNDGKRFFSLYKIAIDSQKSHLLFADELADAIGKDLTAQFYPWHDGNALLMAERDGYARLWLVDGTGEPRSLSPDNVEVLQAAPNSALEAVAFVGADISHTEKSTERRLILARKSDGLWETRVLETGVFLLPKWVSYWLAYAHDVGDEHAWTIAARDCREDGAATTYAPCTRAFGVLSKQDPFGVRYTVVRRSAAQPRNAALIYVQGPHRQITSGAQDSFFHQWLFSAVLKLEASGVAVLSVNAPGSIGLGAQTRQPPNPPLSIADRVSGAISALVSDLAHEGIDRIGIMCGSLAAIPVLRSLPTLALPTACCFVSAVFDPSAALEPHWLHVMTQPSADKARSPTPPFEPTQRSSLLFIHGEDDEFAPVRQCVQLIRSLPDIVETRLILMPGEGHIFRAQCSWAAIATESYAFFQRHLVCRCNA